MRFLPPRLSQQIHRRTQEYVYDSRAVYYPPASVANGTDDYGHPTEVTAGTPIECSFEVLSQTRDIEQWKDYADVNTTLAEIRFSGLTPDKGGTFRVTGRFADYEYKDESFEIVYIDNRGRFGYKCILKQAKV